MWVSVVYGGISQYFRFLPTPVPPLFLNMWGCKSVQLHISVTLITFPYIGNRKVCLVEEILLQLFWMFVRQKCFQSHLQEPVHLHSEIFNSMTLTWHQTYSTRSSVGCLSQKWELCVICTLSLAETRPKWVHNLFTLFSGIALKSNYGFNKVWTTRAAHISPPQTTNNVVELSWRLLL